MTGLLQQMARSSTARWEAAEAARPLAALRAAVADLPPPPALRLDGRFDLIAECKRRAPSVGALVDATEGDPAQAVADRAATYARHGAAAVSVLTEPDRFDGSLDHLRAAVAATAPFGVPVMRKDFLVAPYQVVEARAAGAGGVLLIARMLDDAVLEAMLQEAAAAGLFVLLEAFDAADLERCRAVAEGWSAEVPLLVGLNTRDLVTLDVDGGRLERLADQMPTSVPAVAESGLKGPDDVRQVVGWGYRLGLVGTALMRADDPGVALQALLAAGRGTP